MCIHTTKDAPPALPPKKKIYKVAQHLKFTAVLRLDLWQTFRYLLKFFPVHK